MRFEETPLTGAYLLTVEPHTDERGFFARSFCKKEFAKHGLQAEFVQCNISYNHKKGTVRGLHYQTKPHEEVKVVACRTGCIYDVIFDLRLDSETYGQWYGVELSEENFKCLYIPTGIAHGFQTMTDKTEVFYLMGNYYFPECARGISVKDPNLAIKWPYSDMILSENDKNLPNFSL